MPTAVRRVTSPSRDADSVSRVRHHPPTHPSTHPTARPPTHPRNRPPNRPPSTHQSPPVEAHSKSALLMLAGSDGGRTADGHRKKSQGMNMVKSVAAPTIQKPTAAGGKGAGAQEALSMVVSGEVMTMPGGNVSTAKVQLTNGSKSKVVPVSSVKHTKTTATGQSITTGSTISRSFSENDKTEKGFRKMSTLDTSRHHPPPTSSLVVTSRHDLATPIAHHPTTPPPRHPTTSPPRHPTTPPPTARCERGYPRPRVVARGPGAQSWFCQLQKSEHVHRRGR